MGKKGSGDDEFSSLIIGIAADEEGFVYVTGLSHRVQKFTSDGRFVSTWGGYGSGEGQFAGPHGIASDGRGFVYVADTGNDRIQKFTSDGEFLKEWGCEGSGDGEFSSPTAITVDEDGVTAMPCQETPTTPVPPTIQITAPGTGASA